MTQRKKDQYSSVNSQRNWTSSPSFKTNKKKIYGIVSNLFMNLLTLEPTTPCTAKYLTEPRLCYCSLISTNLVWHLNFSYLYYPCNFTVNCDFTINQLQSHSCYDVHSLIFLVLQATEVLQSR